MTATVVYLDKLFIGNLLADSLILWAAGRLSQIKVKGYRIMIGSVIGSLYSLALFLPGTEYLLGFPLKFAVSLLMITASFAPLPPRKLALCTAFFYLVSFVSGGAVIGISYFLSQTGGVERITGFSAIISRHIWWGLIFAMAAIWAGVAVLPRYFKSRQGLLSMKLAMTIFLEGKGVTVRGLIDTGNSLCDPVSGEPVVVVDYSALKDLLPGPMKDSGACSADAVAMMEKMMDTSWSGRLRLIPFQSLGNDRGLLLGIKPDRVEFVWDSRKLKVEKVIIGLHGKRLDAGRDYNAIINPALLERTIPA
jgi:stage II sporulation protein GA (sporulation sigma-E factor processing peptidase)